MARRAVVTGEVALLRNFQRQQRVLEGPRLDAGIRQALEPLEVATKMKARGRIGRDVVTAKISGTGRNRREFWVSFRRSGRKLAHLLEFGTAPHWQPNRGVMHPGARAFPFFRPAYEETKDTVISRFTVWAWNNIRLTIGRR